jgi:hypothetical protein
MPEYAPLIEVKAELWNGTKWISAAGLVDCGAQGCLINRPLTELNDFASLFKPQPMSMTLADGGETRGGVIDKFTPLQLKIGSHTETIAFDISTIGYDFILGMSWCKKHDPHLLFSNHRLFFTSSYCKQHCLETGSPCEAPIRIVRDEPHLTPCYVPTAVRDSNYHVKSSHHAKPSPPERSIGMSKVLPMTRDLRRGTCPPVVRNVAVENVADQEHPRQAAPKTRQSAPKIRQSSPKTPRQSALKTPSIGIIGAAALTSAVRAGGQLFALSYQQMIELGGVMTPPPRPQIPTSTTRQPASCVVDMKAIEENILRYVPPEYHEFADVFSKEEASKLPPHREYDHRIPLQDDASPPFGPLYRLSPAEEEVLRKYIRDNLTKKFIRHSQSPCGAPVLFVKKADGSLRLCVDYRGLNKLTTKNRYPLPLITELLDRLGKARYFTKFDMRDGYYLLRMAAGEEWKTAFRTRMGLFEYQVMPFGLCNAPGTFQHFVNDTFKEFLDDFLVAYLDDLLIYSSTLKEHKRHVRLILERLRAVGLYIKPEKCQFHVEEVAFLGFLISNKGVRMDPAKVDAVLSWPVPRSVHDIQVFLGFANFYRRFIKRFSRIVTPITTLLKKGIRFHWTTAAQKSFDELKEAFTTAPILRHFDPHLPAILEVDSSDYAAGGVLSQRSDEGKLYPCAFYSRKYNPAELNYEIYDKEMLAVVECLETWRHHLEGSGMKITIFSDHKNLLWFTETKVYNRRQARWAEKLSKFDFVIIFRPGKRQGKPDALSRRPDYRPYKEGGGAAAQGESIFLKTDQVDTSLLDSAVDVVAVKLNTIGAQAITTDDDLAQAIKNALPNDPNIGPYLENLSDPTLPQEDDVKEFLEPFSLRDDLVLRNGLVYIPQNDEIKVQILKSCHDSFTAGHLGQAKTLELVTRDYHWPGMRQFINEYIKSCDTCSRNKTPRQTPHGPLHPLPIPPAPWSSVSMDFIVELPLSNGFDAIYVCVDRFTKMAHFCPTTIQVTAEETARLYLRHVFKHHGLPTDIVSDRGTQFTSRLMSALLDLCDVKSNKSTAFHPQSDGQTERVNQVLEQYLRIFCDYQQDNWYQLLSLAEFAYNNAQHSATQVSPFFANYGYNPRCTIKVIPSTQEESTSPVAEDLVAKLQRIHTQIRSNLADAQRMYKKHYDSHVKSSPLFKVGDQVWLSRKNISTTRPSRKLDVRRLGPFKIVECIGESKLAYKLDLPATMRIHPVFHESLLTPYHANRIAGRTQTPPPAIEVEGEQEYEVEEILDSKIIRNKLRYLVSWTGYAPNDRTWEPAEHLENSPEITARYHARYPQRPAPSDIPRPMMRPTRQVHFARFDTIHPI